VTTLPTPANMAVIATSLRGLRAPLERGTGRAGQQLEQAIQALDGLGGCFQALESELHGAAHAAAIGQLEHASTALRGIDGLIRAERQALEQMQGQLLAIGGSLGQLDATVRAVGMLTVTAKVCASGLGAMGEDFSAFTSEIARLFDLSRRSLEGFQQAVLRLQEDLQGGLARQATFARQQADAIQSVPAALAEGVAAVSRRLRAGAEAAGALREQTEALGRQTAETILALRSEDSVLEPLEQVGQALLALPPVLEREAMTVEQRGIIAADSCHRQSARLLGVAEMQEVWWLRLAESLRALAAEARRIATAGAEACGAAERRGGMLGMLEPQLRQATVLLRDFRAAQAEVEGVARGIATAVAQLVAHISTVRGLETDLRLMSLNMTLKSGRLHDAGRTLHTIARELRTCADQTTQIVSQITRDLSSVTALAQEHAQRGRLAEEVELEGLDGVMSGAMASLGGAGRQMSQARSTLEEGGGTAVTALEAALAALAEAGIAPALRDLSRRLVASVGERVPSEAEVAAIRHLLPAPLAHGRARALPVLEDSLA
jgi:hypothetical protein